jgi:uncharacterized protein YkwD
MRAAARTARGWIVAAAVAAVAIAAAIAPVALGVDDASSPAAEGAACATAETPVAELSRAGLRKALLCTLNEAREERDLGPLTHSPKLQEAAQKHTVVMVETDCLEHRCGREPDLEARIRRAGYLRGARRWRYAENTGCGGTAAAMTDNWLDRQFHRTNILSERFDEVGIGVLHMTPDLCGTDLATFTAVFGWRKS